MPVVEVVEVVVVPVAMVVMVRVPGILCTYLQTMH